MEDDSRTILLLKIGVGTVVLIILIIVAIIIFNVVGKSNDSGNYETTTRRTLSEITEKDDDEEESTKKTKKTTSSTTKTTNTSSTTTTVVTQAPQTQAPSSGGGSSSGGSSSGGYSGGGSSGGGGYTYTPAPQPSEPVIVVPDFTEIKRGNATGYSFALDNYEWDFTDKVNATKKFKTASELRTVAERIASACCDNRSACYDIADDLANEYGFNFAGYNSSGLHIMNRDGSLGNRDFLNDVYSRLTKNYNLVGSPYEWIGVGFIQSSTNNSLMCYAVVLA